MNKFILNLIITGFFLIGQSCFALQGNIEYSQNLIDYTRLDFTELTQKGNDYFEMAEKSNNKKTKEDNYSKSLLYYNVATKVYPEIVQPYIRLGEIYGKIGQFDLAQKNFFVAINLEAHNPQAHREFGDFYFDFKMYQKALKCYEKAYKYGYQSDFYTNYNLASTYERLADLESAKKYYKSAFKINPHAKNLQTKINSLEDLNYKRSGYYLFKRINN